MDKKNKSNEDKEKTNKLGRNNLFLAILIVVIIIIAIIGIGAISYNNENNLNNTNKTIANLTNNITNESTNLTENNPKEGYSQAKLAGFNFYAPNKYLGNYNKGDYFDAFKNGKDYEKTLNAKDDFDRAFLNSAQLIFISKYGKSQKVKSDDGTYYSYPNKTSFKIEVYPKSTYPHNFDELGIYDKEFTKNKNITLENLNINGNNVKVAKTGKGFMSQNVVEDETYVYFELKDKSILIEFTNVPIDNYLIESFFKLN